MDIFGKSAKSFEEMQKKLKQMEKCFDESELAIEFWTLAQAISRKGRDYDQVLTIGKRALSILLSNDDKNLLSSGKRGNRIILDIVNTGVESFSRCHTYKKQNVITLLEKHGAKRLMASMHVKHPREVPEYGIDPRELDFTNSVDITKGTFKAASWGGTQVATGEPSFMT